MTRDESNNNRGRAATRTHAPGSKSVERIALNDEDEESIELVANEDESPEDGPAYQVGPSRAWHPDQVRLRLAVSAVVLFGLTLCGMFALILLKVSAEQLLAWQGAVGTTGTLAGAVVTYYFTKRSN
jgi:hypothetical protein